VNRVEVFARRWISWLGATAVALGAFAYLMAYPPALGGADESYILYEAKRLWEGDVPYRDFFDFIMPGTFYYYALAYTVAGPTILAAKGATALLNAGSCGFIFLLARHVASPALAGLAAAAFVAGMVPTWNHAGHHWIATLLSLAAAAVVLSDRWRNSCRARPLLAGGLAAALMCSHQGRGTWVVLWLGIVTPLLAWARSPLDWGRRSLWEGCWMALGAMAVAAPMLGWVVWRASLREVIDATYTFVTQSYRQAHLGQISWAATFDALGAKPLPTTWFWLLRALPALLGIEGLALGGAILRDGLRPQIVRAALFLLAVLTAFSVFYFPDHIHVATIACFSLIVLAGLAQRIGASLVALRRPVVTAAWRLGVALVAVAVLVKGAQNLTDARELTPLRVASGFGTLAVTGTSARILRDLQDRLGAGPTRPRLFAYPADAWLYLAVPADNPTPFCLLRKGYNTPEQIEVAIARLREDPDAFVSVNWLLLPQDDPIMDLVRREYDLVGGAGPAQPPLGLQGLYLFARRARPSDGRPQTPPAGRAERN